MRSLLLVISASFTVAVALQGAASFRQGITFPTLPGPLASLPADFNNDGSIDLAISNTAVRSVSILLGKDDGTFGNAVNYSTGTCQPGQIISGDFNRDGKLDLLGTCTLTPSIFVLPGLGDGGFGAPIFSEAPFPVVSGFLDGYVEPLSAADINGDGIPDLALIIQTTAVVGLESPGAVGQTVTLTGNGDGTFGHVTPLAIGPPGTETYEVQLADVNGDGKPDIVGVAFSFNSGGLAAPYDSFLFVALGDGRGGFNLVHYYALNGVPQLGMMVADLNADGKLDVVFAGLSISVILNGESVIGASGIGVFLGAGDGSFAPTYSAFDNDTTEYQLTVGAALGKVAGTEYPDVVTALITSGLADDSAVTGNIVVRPNNGDGTFGAPQNLSAPSSVLPFSLDVADFNGDGSPDIVSFGFAVDLFDLIFGSNVDILTDIDAIGSSIAAYPAATASILLNNNASISFTDTNAANFKTGALASSSIVSAFGASLAASTASAATLPLPFSLGGASISVTDSLGVTRPAPLFYASPKQINYAFPDGTATGMARVTLTAAAGTFTVQQQIVSVAPGIFSASNLAVGQVLTYPSGGGSPVSTPTVQSTAAGALAALPIVVSSAGANVFLVLYGTGLRAHQNAVTAAIGNVTVPVAYAGAQGAYVGEDQINIQLPSTLAGAGTVGVTLTVDGVISNTVQILLQ